MNMGSFPQGDRGCPPLTAADLGETVQDGGSDEVRQRACAHLLHDLRAMFLKGAIADPQFLRDGFVGGAADHPFEHLPLPCRERFNRRPELPPFSFLGTSLAVVHQTFVHGFEQPLVIGGFLDEIQRPGLQRLQHHGNIAMPG